MSHKATPEQWATTEEYANAAIGCYSDSCLLELRSRIEALEAAANSKPTPNPSQIRSSPADGLMQVVSAAICSIVNPHGTPLNWAPEARAAILAVARWLENERGEASMLAASWLREEVERG
jgi:hypothetical protein